MKGTKKIIEGFAKDTKRRIERKIVSVGAVRSGKLLGSIDYDIKGSGDEFDIEFSMIDYGKFVDEGTRYIQPRHFFNEVIEDETKKFERDLEKELEKEILDSVEIKNKK